MQMSVILSQVRRQNSGLRFVELVVVNDDLQVCLLQEH